jgi:hypothetical protein
VVDHGLKSHGNETGICLHSEGRYYHPIQLRLSYDQMDYPMTFGVMAGKRGETVAGSGDECIRNPIECRPPISWDVNKKFSVLYAINQRRPTEGIEGTRLDQ